MMPPKLRSIVEQKESSSDANSEQQGAPSMTSTREEQLSTKIYQISIDQYNRGVKLFESNNLDDAKECFKDALAARLVSHGPDSDQVLITHHYLRLIAHKQGDQCKSEYHGRKMTQIQNAIMRRKFQFSSSHIDWNVLSGS
eukprot:scaffold42709_cov103-Cyclotella_meneghiniana.AAC.4